MARGAVNNHERPPLQFRFALLERGDAADYAGEFTTAVARLEQINSPEDMEEVAEFLAAVLGDPEHEELRCAFRDWVFVLYKRMKGEDDPGPPPPGLTLEEIRKMTLEERVAEWPEQWRLEGERRGIEQGKQLGIEQGRREQLRSLAEVRFGASAAARLSALLQREDDPRRLDAIGKAVVRCGTADELLRQASDEAAGA